MPCKFRIKPNHNMEETYDNALQEIIRKWAIYDGDSSALKRFPFKKLKFIYSSKINYHEKRNCLRGMSGSNTSFYLHRCDEKP